MYKSWMWKQRSYREQFQGDEHNGTAGGTGESQAAELAESNNGDQEAEPAKAETVDASGELQPAEDDDEVVITLGDEPPAPEGEDEQQGQAAPNWLKDLRKADREKTRKIRELEAKLAESAAPKADVQAVAKPTLAECDYDEEAFETKLTAWHEQQGAVKAKAKAEADAKAKQQQEWEAKHKAFQAAREALKAPDVDGAMDEVNEKFSDLQRAIMLDAIESPDMQAKLAYALGNNPAELKRLSAITNPIKFGVAVSKLEDKLKVAPRKAPPAPEKQIGGSANAVGVQDTKLARLEAEAERTGEYTDLLRYKRELRAAGK